MLTEEALIALAALGVLGLAVLGAWEMLWPSRRKQSRGHPAPPADRQPPRARRSTRPRHAGESGRAPSARPRPTHGTPATITRTPIFEDSGEERRTALAADDVTSVAAVDTPGHDAITGAVGGTAPAEASLDARKAEQGPPRLSVPAGAHAPAANSDSRNLVDACFDLYQARKFDELIARGVRALTTEPLASAGSEHGVDAAALWSLVGLARRGKGDDAGARAALENAITSAPASDRATYERQLGTLAVTAGQAAIARASMQAAPESEARVSTLREALAWLDRGQAVAPEDAALRDLAAAAHALLWPAYEEVALALVQRQEFRAARRLLRDALADPNVPESRAATYRQLMSGTFGGEIGQLTAQAIRSMHEARESEALAALTRAERLLETLSESALPRQRREEVDRRLWWGYNKLGVRRLEAGEYEAALDPLLAALRFPDAGPERLAQTRAALVRALDGVAETRALAIAEVADGGDREAAVVQADRLWTLLRNGMDAGVGENELATAFARVRRLLERLESAHE